MLPEEIRGVAIDAELVRRLIALQFPEWSHLPVSAIEPGGWDNRTFRLGDHMSVRLPSAAAYVPQIEKEHRWLPELAPHLPLPIPAPLSKGMPAEGFPWPWSVYRWLDGTPAADGRITDLAQFARSLAGFLAALHRIDTTGAPPAGPHNFHRGGRLAIYDDETRAALSTLTGCIETAAARDVWEAALASEWRRLPVWVHGDIAWGNLLVQDGALSAVIDFGSSAVGDPAGDLVIAWDAVPRREPPGLSRCSAVRRRNLGPRARLGFVEGLDHRRRPRRQSARGRTVAAGHRRSRGGSSARDVKKEATREDWESAMVEHRFGIIARLADFRPLLPAEEDVVAGLPNGEFDRLGDGSRPQSPRRRAGDPRRTFCASSSSAATRTAARTKRASA